MPYPFHGIREFFFSILIVLILISQLSYSSLFLYESHTPYFIFILLVCIAVVITSLKLFNTSFQLKFGPSFGALSLFVLYVLFHGFLKSGALGFNHFYILFQYLYLLLIITGLSTRVFNVDMVFKAICLIAFVEASVCLLQFAGLMKSHDINFRITGTCENPNVTAMFLAMSIPAILSELLKKSSAWKLLVKLGGGLLLIALILLKCRTAIIGGSVSIMLFFLLKTKLHVKVLEKVNAKRLIFTVFLTIFFSISIGYSLYNLKKTSADHRLLIYRVCASMIKGKPLWGYGFGSFSREYNLFQANLIRSNQVSYSKQLNEVSQVQMAYNEILENAVEGGIIGATLFFGVFVSFLYSPSRKNTNRSLDQNDTNSDDDLFFASYSAVGCFVLMSCVNFTVQAIPVMGLLMVYGGYLSFQHGHFGIKISKSRSNFVALLYGICGIILLKQQFVLAKANYINKTANIFAKQGYITTALEILEPLADPLHNYESYWNNAGAISYAAGQFNHATECFNQAKKYTASASTYLKCGEAFLKLKDYSSAEDNFLIASYLQPTKFRAKVLLLALYSDLQQKDKVINMANQILRLTPRIPSSEVAYYKGVARETLQQYSLK